ncbi:MAG: glycosyltransferase [Desulfotomaculaceae bacterium]|nr:glycosyltransferase [Desulfotomaculaceae bacterium]
MGREQEKVSIIIAACNEGDNLIDTVDCILTNTTGVNFEVVVVDDGSTDGSGDHVAACFKQEHRVVLIRTAGSGVAGGRNLGAQAAAGEIFVFLDGHTYTPPGWLEALTEPLHDRHTGMVGPVFASLNDIRGPKGFGGSWRGISLEMDWLPRQSDTPYPVPILPGGCQVISRRIFEKIGGYESGMSRWGSEDLEISLRTWLLGYDCVLQPEAVVYHLFRNSHPYHVAVPQVIYNRLRLALLHFNSERAGRVIDHYRGLSGFGKIMAQLTDSDVSEKRKELFKLRSRDDNWYFTRFGCQV